MTWVNSIPLMFKGLSVSFWIALASGASAIAVGIIIAGTRVMAPRLLASGLRLAVTAIRNTPLLVQVFIGYYVLPELGLLFPAPLVGVVVLSVHFSTYCSEALFASIRSVSPGQWEGGYAINLREREIFRIVVLPQALRSASPTLFNYMISLFKDTAILAVITVPELLQSTRAAANATFAYLPLFTVMGLLYFGVSYPASVLSRRLEQRFT